MNGGRAIATVRVCCAMTCDLPEAGVVLHRGGEVNVDTAAGDVGGAVQPGVAVVIPASHHMTRDT